MFPVFGRIDWQLYLLARMLSFASEREAANYVALLYQRSITADPDFQACRNLHRLVSPVAVPQSCLSV
jgi:hypothetical protein